MNKSLLVLGLLNSFLAGACLTIFFLLPPAKTWEQIAAEMPYATKRDIAIDFCVAHRRMCRTLPLSSPVNPAD